MENIDVFSNTIQLFNNIVNFGKYLFDSNWLLGIVASVIMFVLCIAFIFYALFAFLLFFIYTSFKNGQYLQSIIGILILGSCYFYGKKKEEGTITSNNNETPTSTNSRQSFDNEQPENHEKKEHYYHDNNINEDMDSLPWSYKVLGCHPSDSFKKIKQAYRELAKQYHPDGFYNKPQEFIDIANKKMNEINRAYKDICDIRGEQ